MHSEIKVKNLPTFPQRECHDSVPASQQKREGQSLVPAEAELRGRTYLPAEELTAAPSGKRDRMEGSQMPKL